MAVAGILEEIWCSLKLDVEGKSQSIHKCDSHWHVVNIGRTESSEKETLPLFWNKVLCMSMYLGRKSY